PHPFPFSGQKYSESIEQSTYFMRREQPPVEGIPHIWELSPHEAIALQKRLADQVDTSTPIDIDSLELVAGVDVSVKNNISRAAIVVLTFPGLEVVEAVTERIPTPFPYISGLL